MRRKRIVASAPSVPTGELNGTGRRRDDTESRTIYHRGAHSVLPAHRPTGAANSGMEM